MQWRNITPYETFGTLMEEIMSPKKYGTRILENVGTKDKPSIVTRGEWVKRMVLTTKNSLVMISLRGRRLQTNEPL